MKIAICDDHSIVSDELSKMIKTYNDAFEVSCFERPSTLYENMKKEKPNVLFMDLNFFDYEEDGIDWLKKINKEFNDILVIILTAYEERFKEGYEVRAFRFMTKPIEKKELYDYLQACEDELDFTTTIEIKRRGTEYSIPISDICYIAAQCGGSEMWTKNDMFPSEESLLRWEEKLPEKLFFRCHNKYLINFLYIESYDKQNLLLINGEKIPVARRRFTEFQKKYMSFDTR